MSDENNNENKKRIELWEGHFVDFDDTLTHDFNYMADLRNAIDNDDIGTIVSCYFALVGGEKVFNEFRDYVISHDERGIFNIDKVTEAISKINEYLPKDGSRAQRRGWKTLK